MPFTLFQQFKAFVASLVATSDTTEKKIITVDVEAGLWNGLCVEDLSPKVTVHTTEGFEVKVK
jgi:hypothetical protein